jgi:hypothetical protein
MEDEQKYFGRLGRNRLYERIEEAFGRNDARADRDEHIQEGRNSPAPIRISPPTPPPPPPPPRR